MLEQHETTTNPIICDLYCETMLKGYNDLIHCTFHYVSMQVIMQTSCSPCKRCRQNVVITLIFIVWMIQDLSEEFVLSLTVIWWQVFPC